MDAIRKPEVIVIPPTKGMLNPKKSEPQLMQESAVIQKTSLIHS